MSEYVASLVRPLLPTTETPLERVTVDDVYPVAGAMLDRLELAREKLVNLERVHAMRAASLSARARKEEKALERAADGLEGGVGALSTALDAIETRVSHVASRTGRVGERLRVADAQRLATTDAVSLATHLAAFNACESFEDLRLHVDPLFYDQTRSPEAARLAQRLLRVATEAAESERARRKKTALAEAARVHRRRPPGTGPRPGGAGASSSSIVDEVDAKSRRRERGEDAGGGPKPLALARAIDNLERYCDQLENDVLLAFAEAEDEGDLRAMKRAAKTLSRFNQGSSLISRFIATRPMFMSVDAVNEIEARSPSHWFPYDRVCVVNADP